MYALLEKVNFNRNTFTFMKIPFNPYMSGKRVKLYDNVRPVSDLLFNV